MKQVASVIICLSLATAGWSQNETDALRYSFLQYQGTARYNAMGGAFGALGGDATTSMINPAGIGVFRKSDMSFSLAYDHNVTRTYNSVSGSQLGVKSTVFVDNFSFIIHTEPRSYYWRSFNVGITYSKSANFNQSFTALNPKGTSSLLDVYTSKLNYYNIDPSTISDNPDFAFGTNLAWQTYLVDTSNGQYFHHFMNYNQEQSAVVTQKGTMGETDINFSGNIQDMVYVGVSFGFPRIRYAYLMDYRENKIENDTVYYFNSFTYTNSLTTAGNGFNLKVGAIARVSDWMRVGAAWHSPTLFSLTDNWISTMTAYDDQYGSFSYDSPEGIFDYSLKTPGRAIFSTAFIIDKRGLISLDYELIDYSNARLIATNDLYSFNKENNNIENAYHQTFNLRAGGELRLDNWFVRGGAAFYGNPYQSALNYGQDVINYSIGGGYRDASFYFDLSFVMSGSKSTFFMYDENLIEPFTVQSSSHRVTATLGFRFD